MFDLLPKEENRTPIPFAKQNPTLKPKARWLSNFSLSVRSTSLLTGPLENRTFHQCPAKSRRSSSSVTVIYISYCYPLQNKKSPLHGRTREGQWARSGSSTCPSRHSPHIVFNLILHMVSFQSESKALVLTNHNRSPLIRLATKDGCRRHSASPSMKSHLICMQNTRWR